MGNSLVCSPLGSHLFHALVVALRHNFCRTYDLKRGNPGYENKFKMGTPQEVESSLARTWLDDCPTPRQIVDDVMRFNDKQLAIIDARGTVVPDQDHRSGRRRIGAKHSVQMHPDCAVAERATSNKHDGWIAEPVWGIVPR